MNLFTTTNEIGKLAILAADNKVYNAPIMLVIREGATKDMIVNTLKRFAYGCKLLAAGISFDSSNDTMRKVDTFDYGINEWHDEARVQIWVKGTIPVCLPNDQMTSVSVNVFTEITLVEDFVGYVNDLMEVMPALTDILTQDAPAKQSPPPAQQRHRPGQEELDEQFPRDENNNPITERLQKRQQPAQPPQKQPPQPPTPTNTPHFGDYKVNYAQKRQLGDTYGGQVISFNIAQVKTVGTEVELYGTYNGGSSKYPMVKVQPEYIRDETTKQFLLRLIDEGGTSGLAFRGVFYVNRKPDGKTYLNLNKLDRVDNFPLANAFVPALANEPPDETSEDNNPVRPYDDIPF
jgi:hypothetical protein